MAGQQAAAADERLADTGHVKIGVALLLATDRERFVKRLGVLTDQTLSEVLGGLLEMFAE